MDSKAHQRSPAHDPAALEALDTETKRRSFVSSLLDWYLDVRRDLPWRRSPDPYRVWLSEVMLQQTRVETVIPYFERFLERFPTVLDLAAATEDDVLSLWSGLGYYRRARSLREGARALLDRHGGEFPRTLEEALALPGVGPYTAAAILSIAYGLPHPVVDGNVERVVTRLLRWDANPRQASMKRKIRQLLESLIPQGRASDFNQAMMELGATVCVPAAPRCLECPVARACEARRHGDAESYPVLPPRRKTIDVRLEAGVIRNGDRYLLERSSGMSYLEGLWLFPLVEKESDVL